MSLKQDPARLPMLTVELALSSLTWQITREIFGQRHCADRGVGAMRRRMGPAPETIDALDHDEMVRDSARTLLATFCEECPHSGCRMKLPMISGPSR